MPGHDCVGARVHINLELTESGSRRVLVPRGVLERAHPVVMAGVVGLLVGWAVVGATTRLAGEGEVLRRKSTGQDRGRGLLNSGAGAFWAGSAALVHIPAGPARLTKENEPELDPLPPTPSTSNAIDRNNNCSLTNFLGLNLKLRACPTIQVLICIYFMHVSKIAVSYEFSEIYAKW